MKKDTCITEPLCCTHKKSTLTDNQLYTNTKLKVKKKKHLNLENKTKQLSGKKGQFRKAKAAANGNGYLESYISSKLIYKICTLTLFL